jgi:hypothetical protein
MNYSMQSNSTANIAASSPNSPSCEKPQRSDSPLPSHGEIAIATTLLFALEKFFAVSRSNLSGPNRLQGRTIASGPREITRVYILQTTLILVAYIFAEDMWYVFPVALVENRKIICVTPGSKRSPFEPYREAWKLMRPPEPEIITAEPVAAAAAAPDPTAAADSGSAP